MAETELIFITGGVRSGKSAFAEQQLQSLAKAYQAQRLIYVATGVAFDDEMKKRIARHKLDRKKQKQNWVTVEQPTNLQQLLLMIQKGDVVLWDCVTTWLTNEFYEGFETGICNWQQPLKLTERIAEMKKTILTLRAMQIPLVIVSNEVLDEPISKFTEVKLFQKYLGQLHQWFVQQATIAIEMEYGYAHRWK
ncbi:bifunctional adenosylcobinamide kinase/adenosylcobinamide-phosphate guanylyltransferase [uncultured Rummeliibacillus sp.]|uniref:bifunctional adenosylcobinamide kinase/adenosylcobinamide-phosphate guanylyltransferase n=1 Tax=uncultured Rummeliibacillus sp. TaxID=762292 RepID=UPI002630FC33|nr:bifunctional adenosylcobinamide kinase/adenosylcobinamide-phosphate guanylyltransferase [uncultured Rummeliibacillus sp.]